jgi:hypothetical protein
VKNVCFFTYKNVVEIVNLFIFLNLIELLTDKEMSPDKKISFSLLLAFLWVAPFAAAHYFTYRRNFWRAESRIKMLLNGLIFQKFLEYDGNTDIEACAQNKVHSTG